MKYYQLPNDYLYDYFIIVKADTDEIVTYKETIGEVISYLSTKRKRIANIIITDSRCYIKVR